MPCIQALYLLQILLLVLLIKFRNHLILLPHFLGHFRQQMEDEVFKRFFRAMRDELLVAGSQRLGELRILCLIH